MECWQLGAIILYQTAYSRSLQLERKLITSIKSSTLTTLDAKIYDSSRNKKAAEARSLTLTQVRLDE